MQTSLTISQNGVFSLSIIKKWSKILAIGGFIITGLTVVLGFVMMLIFDNLPQAQGNQPFPSFIFLLFYSLFGIVYFIPSYYLLKFSKNIALALESGLEANVDDSLKYLRSFFAFIGVLSIISAALFVFFIIIAAAIAMFAPMPPSGMST